MKRLLVSVVLVLGTVTSVRAADAPQGHPDSSSWPNLFAEDLSNAIYPPGVWSFQNGILTATKDQILWTREQYANGVIDLEFRNSPGTNSGVFVYSSTVKNPDWVSNSIEVQILDDYAPRWSEVPKTWLCGGIFGRLAPAKQMVKKAGEWNRMTVTCKRTSIVVLLNGEQTADLDMKLWTSGKKNPDGSDVPPWLGKPLAGMPTKGYVGLQGKHGDAPIEFRNLKIKKLD